MEKKLDTLGRRIPQFDRIAAAKKAQKTREDNHGADFNKRIAGMGGRIRTRGYFGKLKDTDPQKLKELNSIAGKKSANRPFSARSASAKKGAVTRRTRQSQTVVRGDIAEVYKKTKKN